MAHSFYCQKPSEEQSPEATIHSSTVIPSSISQPLPLPWRTLTIGASEAHRAVTTEFLTFSFTLLLTVVSMSGLIMEKNCKSCSAWWTIDTSAMFIFLSETAIFAVMKKSVLTSTCEKFQPRKISAFLCNSAKQLQRKKEKKELVPMWLFYRRIRGHYLHSYISVILITRKANFRSLVFYILPVKKRKVLKKQWEIHSCNSRTAMQKGLRGELFYCFFQLSILWY